MSPRAGTDTSLNVHSRASASADVEVTDPDLLLKLSGPGGSFLRVFEWEYHVAAGMRGDTIRLQGDAAAVADTERAIAELLDVLESGAVLREEDVIRSVRTLREHPGLRLRELFEDIVIGSVGQRVVSPRGLTQQRYVRAIQANDLVFGVGPAGTGKTYLAVAMAVRALHEKTVKRIILTRPAVEAGERLGFLPGDLAEKVNPYLRPLYDAMHDMVGTERAQTWLQRGVVEVAPLAFMRGRTLSDSFVILDEAQNATVEQMKMFLTRLGFDSQAVVTGDVTQVDLPASRPSGLADAALLLRDVPGIEIVQFTDADVVRHPLVQRIVRAYDERDAQVASATTTANGDSHHSSRLR